MERDINVKLQAKLPLKEGGYYDITTFVDTIAGFSFKKDFKNVKDHVSLFHLLIENKDYNDATLTRKPILITAVYGKKTADGVTMRGFDPKAFNQPADLDFRNEYFYDTNEDKFFNKAGREISGEKLLKQTYARHIKTTKPIRGFVVRLKLWLWGVWIPWFLTKMVGLLYWILYLISGDKYRYDYLFGEEKLNEKIISSKVPHRIDRSRPTGTAEEKPAKEMNFFGNQVAQWPIVFYSILHLAVWFSLKYIFYPTEEIETFLNNSFLVVLYVIVSFWILDSVAPFLLKKSIKYISMLSGWAHNRKIKV